MRERPDRLCCRSHIFAPFSRAPAAISAGVSRPVTALVEGAAVPRPQAVAQGPGPVSPPFRSPYGWPNGCEEPHTEDDNDYHHC